MLLVRSSLGFSVKQDILRDHRSGMHHQAATWTLSSPSLTKPIHITGVYISPTAGEAEEFFEILANAATFPPSETHLYVGDFNSHIGDEVEGHVRHDPSFPIPARVGDDDHPPAPANMGQLQDQPSSAQRGRLLLRLLDTLQFIVANGRFQSSSDPTPFTLTGHQKRSINDYVLIAKHHFSRIKKCTGHSAVVCKEVGGPA